tara:strand:- start:2888 stop:3259 length:372 start_codon:yes stop_codon:yes gene_type:complete
MIDFDYCKNLSCGKKLKPVKMPRTKAKMCADCRGDAQSDNTLVRRDFEEAQQNPTEPSEDELMFEDSPKAIEENKNDVQRHHWVGQQLQYIGSSLSEILPPTVNKYDSYGRLKYQSKKKERKK